VAPVLAADLGGRADSGALVAPRGGDRAEVLEVERDRPRHVLDREVAGEPVGAVARVLDLGRTERRGRVVLGVEKVRAAEVLVTGGVAAVDLGDVDGRLDRRLERVRGDSDAAAREREAAAHLGHHEVAGRERDVGVAGIERPGTGRRDRGCEGGMRYSHWVTPGIGSTVVVLANVVNTTACGFIARARTCRAGGTMSTWRNGLQPR